MSIFLCTVCSMELGHNKGQCNCMDDLLDETPPLNENWENDFQFIEEAEKQGNIFEMSDFDNGLHKIRRYENEGIEQDIKHEPELQIEADVSEDKVVFIPEADHSNYGYKCMKCVKSFKREATLKAHIKFVHEDVFQPFELPTTCINKTKVNQNNKLEHIVDVRSSECLTDNGFWKCTECALTFSAKFDFKMHINQHEGKKVFQCDICKVYLSNDTILIQHKRKVHNNTINKEKKFGCSVCGERFSLQVFLSNHKKTHIAYNKQLQETALIQRINRRLTYTCKACGKMSSNKSRYEEHLRVHTKERPFNCNLCGTGFTKESSLTSHMKLHSDNRPFKCEICNVTYRHKSNLARHLLKHGGQQPYKCRYCEKTFSQSAIKNDHERCRHTGETPYHCENCQQSFKTSFQLNAHRREKHGIFTNSRPKVKILIHK